MTHSYQPDHSQFNRAYPLSEVSFVFAAPSSAPDQVAFSSIVQAMFEKGVMAIARMVKLEGSDPKIGVLSPRVWPDIDVMLWVQVHIFAVDHHTLGAHMACVDAFRG